MNLRKLLPDVDKEIDTNSKLECVFVAAICFISSIYLSGNYERLTKVAEFLQKLSHENYESMEENSFFDTNNTKENKMKTMQIVVTEEDFNSAIEDREEPSNDICEICPVAKAFRRTFPNSDFRTNQYCACSDKFYTVTIDLPYSAKLFIRNFDGGNYENLRANLPFIFEIEIPEGANL